MLEGITSVEDEWTCLNSFQYEYGVQNVAKWVRNSDFAEGR